MRLYHCDYITKRAFLQKPNTMRNLFFLLLVSCLFTACGGGADQQAKIAGTWHITAMEGRHELQPCEQSMRFAFTDESAEVAGREGYLLKVTQGENPCDLIGPNDNYESAYTFVGDKLFIKNLRLTGGDNWSGGMTIQSFTEDQLVVEILNTTFTFQKAS